MSAPSADSSQRCPVCAAPMEGRAWCIPCVLRGAVGRIGDAVSEVGIPEDAPWSPSHAGDGGEAGGGGLGPGDSRDAPDAAVPEVFGDYRLAERLGEGGMGVVYRAHKISLKKDVAIKFIKAGRRASERQVALFLREAELASKLDHPNIIGVSEVGALDGARYLVMRYVDGEPLSARLGVEGFLPTVRERVGLLVRIARAVHHAHLRGVIHRDLKPGNILIDRDGAPHVGDFGLARWVERDSTVTVGDRVIGTPAYMPPEQARGRREDVTIAGDVWSLGVMLYQLLSGRLPFEADHLATMVHRILHDEPPGPFDPRPVPGSPDGEPAGSIPAPSDGARLFPSARRDLESICRRCLNKEPGRRYPSAGALADDLERWWDGRPVEARPVGPVEGAFLWARRRPALAGLAVVSCLALAALASSLWQRQVSSRTDRLRRQFNYVADLNLALQALAQSNFVVFERAMSDATPVRDEEDLRSVEWGLLQSVAAAATHPAWFQAGEPLWDLAVAPESGALAAVGERQVFLVDAEGRESRRWIRLPGAGKSGALAFSPDGRWLAVVGAGGLELLEVAGPGRVRLSDRPASAVSWSPDGARVAVLEGAGAGGGSPGGVRTYRVAEHRAEDFREGSPHAMGWASEHQLRMVGPRGEIRDWTLGQAGVEEVAPGGYWSPTARLSSDGRLLARTSRYGVVHVLQVPDGRELRTFTGLPVEGVRMAFSGGDWLAMTTKEAAVLVASLRDGREFRLYPGHIEAVSALAFGGEGRWLATGSLDGTVRRMALEARPRESFARIPHRLPTGAGVPPVFSPDGRWVALLEERAFTAPYTNESTLLWNVREARVAGRIPAEVVGWEVPDRLLSWDRDGTLRVWEVADPERPVEAARFLLNPEHDPLIDSQLADGGRWVVSLNRSEEAQAYEVATGRIVRLAGVAVDLLAASPVGERAAVGVVGGGVGIWHLRTGRWERVFDAVPAEMRYSASGRWLAVTDWERQLRLFDGETGRPEAGLRGHLGPVTAVTFSPDDRRLVTGAGDYSLKIWDLATRREVMELPVDAPVFWIRVSPDQRWMVTGHLPTRVGPRFGSLEEGHYRLWPVEGPTRETGRHPGPGSDTVWARSADLARRSVR